jgi:hypothetical protein
MIWIRKGRIKVTRKRKKEESKQEESTKKLHKERIGVNMEMKEINWKK